MLGYFHVPWIGAVSMRVEKITTTVKHFCRGLTATSKSCGKFIRPDTSCQLQERRAAFPLLHVAIIKNAFICKTWLHFFIFFVPKYF